MSARPLSVSAAWLRALGLVLALILPHVALAQTDAGTLRILVSDESRAVVPGAAIEVVNAATGVAQSGVSDATGYGQFSPLPRGLYTVRVSLAGFRTIEVSAVRLDVNERRFLPVTLAVAITSEVVEVVSRAAVIQTEEGSLGCATSRSR